MSKGTCLQCGCITTVLTSVTGRDLCPICVEKQADWDGYCARCKGVVLPKDFYACRTCDAQEPGDDARIQGRSSTGALVRRCHTAARQLANEIKEVREQARELRSDCGRYGMEKFWMRAGLLGAYAAREAALLRAFEILKALELTMPDEEIGPLEISIADLEGRSSGIFPKTPVSDSELGNLDRAFREMTQGRVEVVEPSITWTRVEQQQPPPHKKYIVRRSGKIHTSTVCYGMHAPWWMVHTLDAAVECDPVPMEPDDEWAPLEAMEALA